MGLMKVHPVAKELFHADTQTDRQTGVTILRVRFPNSLFHFNET